MSVMVFQPLGDSLSLGEMKFPAALFITTWNTQGKVLARTSERHSRWEAIPPDSFDFHVSGVCKDELYYFPVSEFPVLSLN